MTDDIEASVRRLEYGHWLRRRTLREAAARVAALEQDAYLRRKTARFGGPPKVKPPDIWPCSSCGGINLPDNLMLTDSVLGTTILPHSTDVTTRWNKRIAVTGTFWTLAGPNQCSSPSGEATTTLEYRYDCTNGNLILFASTCHNAGTGGSNIVGIGFIENPIVGLNQLFSLSSSGTCTPFNRSFTLLKSSVGTFVGAYNDLYGSVDSVTYTLTKPS